MITKFGFICYNLKNIKSNEKKLNRKAFTLFELMVVVMIIGIVYGLVLGSFDPKKSVKITTLKDIKSALSTHWIKGKKVDLYVYEKCKKIALFVNDEIQDDLKLNIDSNIFKDIKVYKNALTGDQREIKFRSVLIDERVKKVCFHYTIFPNGSSSSYIAKSGKNYYVYFPYFEDTFVTTEYDEAKERYQNDEFTKITIHE
jgi:prepilin-type N-terminal cleavage/methylation domain-containing protein